MAAMATAHGGHTEVKTPHDAVTADVSALRFMASAESMMVSNDPRFFQGNVIDKRLAAFAGLAVVSGLMTDTAMGTIMDTNKNFDWFTADGWIHFAGFVLMTFVLWLNLLATYVAVVQTYHTTRLMTSGSTGFEMAAAYYLNKNICFWRHTSIKAMLISLPILLCSMALKLLVKFDTDQASGGAKWVSLESVDTGIAPGHPNWNGVTLSGFITCLVYMLAGCILMSIHQRHMAVFREKYAHLGASLPFLATHSGSLMSRPAEATRIPDV